MKENKKIAVILCGSGYLDGSEIRESILVLLALSNASANVSIFAPDAFQTDVINNLTGKAQGEPRNMLVESARIARGEVRSLSELNTNEFDGVIMPGGFGAAKNLSDFASKGSQGSARKDLSAILNQFHNEKKPIGALCIAPAVVGLAFKNKNFSMTLGQAGEAAAELEKLGHKHVVKSASEAHIDSENKIVTTPAYMIDEAPLSEIFKGVTSLVNEVIRLA